MDIIGMSRLHGDIGARLRSIQRYTGMPARLLHLVCKQGRDLGRLPGM